MSQFRLVDAAHMYQGAIRNITYMPHLAKETSFLYDSLSAAHLQLEQYDNAVISLMKSLHLYPTTPYNWFNVAIVREENAFHTLRREDKSAIDIEGAMDELQKASVLFNFFSVDHPWILRAPEKDLSSDHQKYCDKNYEIAKAHLRKAEDDAKREELKRRLLEDKLKKIMKEKMQEKENETMKEEQLRLAIKEKALKASEKLQSLKGDWQSVETSQRSSKKSKADAYSSDSSDGDAG